MAARIGINGFGRIGRQVLKAILQHHAAELEVVAVNDLADTETNAHLLKYDSNYGRFEGTVEASEESIIINGHKIKMTCERDPRGVVRVAQPTGSAAPPTGPAPASSPPPARSACPSARSLSR